jgi:TRAP transporter 4TM/12TM fusion protein
VTGNVEIHGFGAGFGRGVAGKVIYAVAITFSAFQLWTATFGPLPSIVVRSLHVGFLLFLTFNLLAQRSDRPSVRAAGWVVGSAALVLSFYHWVFHDDLIVRAGDPTWLDIAVGVVFVTLVFEAGRRTMGIALPIICAAFLAYAFLGHLLPAPLDHRGYDFRQVVEQVFLGTEGVFGIPTLVSSTYIFLFILFGSFLERAGMIQLFTDVALGVVGHHRGGPAKVAVVASALMGTINGSGVANVVTTGQFTIPLMKRFGYRPAFAGGVEATASMGGQIMPPVMGAVAFIMAETLGIGYVEVVQAAVIPAILYFVTAFWMVHLEAGRVNLLGLPRSECPSAIAAILKNWHLALPLAGLVYLLFAGYTPLFAGTIGLGLTAILILATPLSRSLGPIGVRIVFWIIIGIACAAFFRLGAEVVLAVVGALSVWTFFAKGGRATLVQMRDALADGAKNAVSVGVACALVGVIIGTMTLTGMGSSFVRVVVEVGRDSLFLSLLMTMVACLILGMGIPTIPNYIITSSLAGPALLELGVPLIISHMFVFYFGIMADLTPPVALAAFAAAPIAKESGMKIGLQAVRIAVAGFVVPFMAVYAPSLMLQSGGAIAAEYGYVLEVAYVVGKALVAIGLWGAAAIGYLLTKLKLIERVVATAAAFLLVASIPVTDEIGFALAVLFVAQHWWRHRRRNVAVA